MSTTLYRKYRPQLFGEIVNQAAIKDTIQQEIITAKLPHAFLFCGPRGTGKTTTARVLAKALNCKKRPATESEPCNACPSCEAMNNGASLSLVEVDAASQTGVDNVRDNIIANARVAVKSDEYKVFIIDEVHMLSGASFNALLKTLEEPPVRVVFILATTEIHKIPETSISRCQRFDFHPVRSDELQSYLIEIIKREEREVDVAVVSSIVRKSGGYVRDAMSLLGQVLAMPGAITPETASFILPVHQMEQVVGFFELVSQADTAGAMRFIHRLDQEGVRPHHYCQELIDLGHRMMLWRVGSDPDMFADGMADSVRAQIEGIASRYSPAQLLWMIEVLIKRHQQLKSLEQGILPLELAVVELTSGPQTASVPSQPIQPSAPAPQPKPQPKAEPAPVKLVASKPAATVKPTTSDRTAKPAVPTGRQAATYDEVSPFWQKVMSEVSEVQHSLFIVLRTSVFRAGRQGEPELAFKYRMHHDHVKRSLATLVVQAEKHLPNKAIRFTLSVDENLASTMPADVVEPKSAETAALGAELSRLADAFGGSVME
ncbi:MAG: DNA polymerase III subunit gamma/tau [Parcubacteria group bacterium]|nr:DNA polymerase III subunit gamma/tau [Parcubacteria group bacterium]